MNKPDLKPVTSLPVTNRQDIPASLRDLADAIESGKRDVLQVVVAVFGPPGVDVLQVGDTTTGDARLILGAAALKLDQAVLEVR